MPSTACPDPVFPIANHTGPQPGAMARGAFSFDRRSTLVVIRDKLTAQLYVDDILRTVLQLFLLQYLALIFQKIRLDHMRCFELSYSLSNTSFASQISLSNQACLGCDGKAIASTSECC
ncbi:uncharacterized protein TNCV_2123131 [Trichonephila clavipes]|nr:uncharacterized protein TNCV_2123131 [Trichonephila clavipes]